MSKGPLVLRLTKAATTPPPMVMLDHPYSSNSTKSTVVSSGANANHLQAVSSGPKDSMHDKPMPTSSPTDLIETPSDAISLSGPVEIIQRNSLATTNRPPAAQNFESFVPASAESDRCPVLSNSSVLKICSTWHTTAEFECKEQKPKSKKSFGQPKTSLTKADDECSSPQQPFTESLPHTEHCRPNMSNDMHSAENLVDLLQTETEVQIKAEFVFECGSEDPEDLLEPDKVKTESFCEEMPKNVKENVCEDPPAPKKQPKVIVKEVRNLARKRTAPIIRKRNAQLQKVADMSRSYVCTICQKRFQNELKLKIHLRMHCGEKPFKCDKCPKRFSHVGARKMHQRVHENSFKGQFSCNFCEKVFLHASAFKVHLRIHTGELPYHCEKCPKKFRGITQLTKHQSRHDQEKRHACPVCLKQFSSKAVLRRHGRVHTGEKPYSCEICQKQFSYEGDRKKHLRTHTKENAKKYPCPLCPKMFSDPFTVKSHMRYHTGKDLHECAICHNKFPSPSHLKKHLQVHTGEKPHTCFICLKSFSDSFVLKKHVRLHTGEKPFKCPICEKGFNQQNHVTRHMKTHTRQDTDRFMCSLCDKSFLLADNLKLHLRLHSEDNPHKCEKCCKMFSSPSHLRRHMIVHSNLKPFTCDICKKSVSSADVLKRHMEVHSDKSAFSCGICLQTFRRAAHVKDHLKTHDKETTRTLKHKDVPSKTPKLAKTTGKNK